MINLVTGERFDRTNYAHKLNMYMNEVYKNNLRNKSKRDINNIYYVLKEIK